MGEHFFQGKTLLCRVNALHQCAGVRVRSRLVDHGQCFLKWHEIEPLYQPFRNQVIQFAGVGGQALEYQVSHPGGSDTFGRRVNGSQCPLRNDPGFTVVNPVLWMNHFYASLAKSRFPIGVDPDTVFESALLGTTEMEESEINRSRFVLYTDYKIAAAAIADSRTRHATNYQCGFAVFQLRDRGDAGAVFVTKGEMEKQVPWCMDTELLQFIG